MGELAKTPTSGDFHVAHRETSERLELHGAKVEDYKTHMRARLRREALEHLGDVLADGREYTVRMWEEVREDVYEVTHLIHTLVFLRDANAALIGDALELAAIPNVGKPIAEFPDGRRFRLQEGQFGGYWRRIA